MSCQMYVWFLLTENEDRLAVTAGGRGTRDNESDLVFVRGKLETLPFGLLRTWTSPGAVALE
jgi:hypothetical protein